MDKKVLNRIASLDKDRQKIFDKKAKLEAGILEQDIDLDLVMRKYDALCFELINELEGIEADD